MSHDVHQVRSFEHPGEGRKRAKATPKGRQIDPAAAHDIERLLGDRAAVQSDDRNPVVGGGLAGGSAGKGSRPRRVRY